MDIRTGYDVEQFMLKLAEPTADDAYLSRPEDEVPFIQLTIQHGFAYVAWTDQDFLGSPVGEPRSPTAHGGYNPHYYAGTGLPLGTAIRLVKYFLHYLKRLPDVAWLDEDVLAERELATSRAS